MTALSTLRLLIADVDPDRQLITDDQATGYLALHGITDPTNPDGDDDPPRWRIRAAAADVLDAIATSEALVGKVIRSQDVTTDGAKLAAELRAQAANHRALAAAEQAAAEAEDDPGLVVLEFHPWR